MQLNFDKSKVLWWGRRAANKIRMQNRGRLHGNNLFGEEFYEMTVQPNYFRLLTFLCGSLRKGTTPFCMAPFARPPHILSYVAARAY